jgi:hypothetical protein
MVSAVRWADALPGAATTQKSIAHARPVIRIPNISSERRQHRAIHKRASPTIHSVGFDLPDNALPFSPHRRRPFMDQDVNSVSEHHGE